MKGFVGVPLDRNIASVLEQAQVVFCYSTAWPTPDGLRLNELSAALSVTLEEGALVIVTDKWLVGNRFKYEGTEAVKGTDGEDILATFWRLTGKPPEEDISGTHTLHGIDDVWMKEDACGDNPTICEDFLRFLGEPTAN